MFLLQAVEIDSTETVLDTISEMKDTDPTVIEEFLQNLLSGALSFGLQLVLAAVVFIIGGRIIAIIRKVAKKAMVRKDMDLGVQQFLDSFIKASCYVLLIFLILTMFGVTTASIVAVLGSAGIAIGLALQGSLSNFAGGVLILILKPFKVGDYIIESGSGKEGTVKEISIFYTKLTTVDNQTVILPNGALSDTSIVNVTAQPNRRLILTIPIAYDADLKKAKELLLYEVENDPDRVASEECIVYVSELADSSVNLQARLWIPTEKYWDVKWRLTEKMKYVYDENNIEIPYQKIDVNIQNK